MKVLYFAWLRQRTGIAEENIDIPGEVETIADLVAWLRLRGEGFEHAFAEPAAVRSAVDQVQVTADASIKGANEVAFFPPMTGG